jgi:hypothetical protein
MSPDDSRPARPLLMLDVDGPLNPYAARPHRRPAGYLTHRLMTPRRLVAEQQRLAVWGGSRVRPVRVWLNPGHGPALSALPYDLVWATTWEEEANDFLAPLLGLPELPVLRWDRTGHDPADGAVVDGAVADGAAADGVFWKTPQIVRAAAGRPFAWVDDHITAADRSWVAERHPGPALLLRIDPRLGLLPADFTALTDWASALD